MNHNFTVHIDFTRIAALNSNWWCHKFRSHTDYL